jgi:hypothetical protein
VTQEYVLPLDTKHATLEVVGGKGRSLAEMYTVTSATASTLANRCRWKIHRACSLR